MKVVFLDFDGVLNSLTFLLAQPGGRHDLLDPAAVARLNTLVMRSSAKVVISSTWRLKMSLDELRSRLTALGFCGEVIDRTPEAQALGGLYSDPTLARCQEIQAWIERSSEPIESFVVLDDAYLEDVAQFLVKTEFETGLADEHIEAALEILG
jgi:hypothetical protein